MNGTISLQSKLKGAVSMANTIINGGASPYPKTVGPAAIASFSDGAQDAPLKSLVFNIEPVQDLHGYDNPWPAGGGKNLLLVKYPGRSNNGVTYVTNSDGTVTLSGTASGSSYFASNYGFNTEYMVPLHPGTYTISGSPNSNIRVYGTLWSTGGTNLGNITQDTGTGSSFTVTEEAWFSFQIFVVSGTNTNGVTIYPQVEKGDTKSPYAPHSNICPISGWTQVDGKHSGADMTDYTPIIISLGRTVYSGTLDVARGKLNVKPYYASYSGQTLVGPWISSHDKYVAGETPTTGAQVVDMGAAGTDYDVTPQTIKTLLGVNNIWADSGDTTLEYYPAAASIVSVLNRSSKVYTSIPLGKIRYETYQITPQQTIDLDSYRSENGNLLRNPVATKCKIEFNTPLMTDSEWADVWNIIKAGFNNNTERKLKLRYYDTLSATYKTGYFYVPDVQTTIRSIEEGAGVINYNEIRIAFIEY